MSNKRKLNFISNLNFDEIEKQIENEEEQNEKQIQNEEEQNEKKIQNKKKNKNKNKNKNINENERDEKLKKINNISLASLRLTCKLFRNLISSFWFQSIPLHSFNN